MVKYKVKCTSCGIFHLNKVSTQGFGLKRCPDCASKSEIKTTRQISIPSHFMKLANLKIGDFLRIVVVKDGLIELRKIKNGR